MSDSAYRILITGANGQLGQSFRLIESIALQQNIQLIFADRQSLDIVDKKSLDETFSRQRFDAVINTAAYTAVDKAESDTDLAEQVNAIGPGLLAEACHQHGAWLLHVSTDYVFDGKKESPYAESDSVNPLGAYGRTKLAGERRVLEVAPDSVILRTSWVFSPFRNNFLKTMIRLGSEREELSIVDDQVGGPTYAAHIAEVLLNIVKRQMETGEVEGGVYHFGGVPHVSWYEFATYIFDRSKALGLLSSRPQVHPIVSSAYPTPAPRPKNSRMSNKKLNELIGEVQSSWKDGVESSLQFLKGSSHL